MNEPVILWYSYCGRTQAGMALTVSLIFLLLMTMLGVSAMQISVTQERMAGNLRDRNLSFQAAEAGLRAGEFWLLTPGNYVIADGNAHIVEAIAPLTLADWTGAGATGGVAGFDPQLAGDPVFHVGPPSMRRTGEGLGVSLAKIRCEPFYPVTARGQGGTDTAVVVLQSTFGLRERSCP